MMKPIRWVHTLAVSLWRRNCDLRAGQWHVGKGAQQQNGAEGPLAAGATRRCRHAHQGGQGLAEASGGAVAVQDVGVVAHVRWRQLQRQQGVRGLAGRAALRHPGRSSGHCCVVRRTPAAARCRLCTVGHGPTLAGERHPRRPRKRGPDSLPSPRLPETAGCRAMLSVQRLRRMTNCGMLHKADGFGEAALNHCQSQHSQHGHPEPQLGCMHA